MSGFVVELPAELQAEVARRSAGEPGGAAAWVAEAVREKLAAAGLAYLEDRADRADRAGFLAVLGRVPAAPPVPGDERSRDAEPAAAADPAPKAGPSR